MAIQHETAGVPDQYLDAVGVLAEIDDHRVGERILGQHLLRQRGRSMGTFTEIDRPRGQQDPDVDHVHDVNARTARNTAVNWAASSMPDATRTTAPASLTSIAGVADDGVALSAGAGSVASFMIGTKSGAGASAVVVAATVLTSRQAGRCQPNTCCEHTCQRRATSDTRAPGASISSTIPAFSSADERRLRTGPVRTSTRRNSPFASLLTSNIAIARSPLCLGGDSTNVWRVIDEGRQSSAYIIAAPNKPLDKGRTTVLSEQVISVSIASYPHQQAKVRCLRPPLHPHFQESGSLLRDFATPRQC